MTQSDPRTEQLIANRRAAAAEKQSATLATLTKMLTEGHRVSFVNVQRAAGVSSWFVYNNPAVRDAIKAAMDDQKLLEAGKSTRPAEDRTTAGLRAELANARNEIHDLRTERDRLKNRLQRALGDHLDAMGKQELVEQLRVVEQDNSRMQAELRSVTAELAASNSERDEAIADRDGAQFALRQMMRGIPQ